jgi:LysR family transcriptional regulator, low CO2-responsive transcriptional regulator
VPKAGGNGTSGGDGGEDTRAKIDILLLQTFHLVARTGSFSAAARELNLSYQTAANHVRRLEQMYGARLLETEKGLRQVTLTPQGKALHQTLGEELDTILSRIRILLRDARSVLRVGVPQALFHNFFPEIVQRFRMVSPDIELAFFERDTLLEQMMMEGALDAAVGERGFNNPAVTTRLIGAYRLALIYPRDWGGRPLTEADVGQLQGRPFITYEPGQTTRNLAVSYLSRVMEVPPQVTTSASGSTSVAQLVARGQGYAIVPEWAVSPRDPKVARIVLNGIEPMRVQFAQAAFLEDNPQVRQLFTLCCDVMRAAFSTEPQDIDESD